MQTASLKQLQSPGRITFDSAILSLRLGRHALPPMRYISRCRRARWHSIPVYEERQILCTASPFLPSNGQAAIGQFFCPSHPPLHQCKRQVELTNKVCVKSMKNRVKLRILKLCIGCGKWILINRKKYRILQKYKKNPWLSPPLCYSVIGYAVYRP